MILVSVVFLSISACGGGHTTTDNEQEKKAKMDYSSLEMISSSESPLILADDAFLRQQISNGIRLKTSGKYPDDEDGSVWIKYPGTFNEDKTPSEHQSGVFQSINAKIGNSGNGYSESITSLEGVDDATNQLYDGQYWYFSVFGRNPGINIFSTDAATVQTQFIGSYSFAEEYGQPGEIYPVNNEAGRHIATIRYFQGNVVPTLPGRYQARKNHQGLTVEYENFLRKQNRVFRLDLLDMNNPASPKLAWSLKLDGALIQSRKVGQMLYLVTRFDPWLEGLASEDSYMSLKEKNDMSLRKKNENLLESLTLNDLLPTYSTDTLRAPLSKNCLVQQNEDNTIGFASLVHLTAIDLNKRKIAGSVCLSSNLEAAKITTESIYVSATVTKGTEASTVIHKFAVSPSGVSYQATGSVQGRLEWKSDPVLRMHEYNGLFQIVTSTGSYRGQEHLITILQPKGKLLEKVSTLPNAQYPDPIGLLGKPMYSVRVEGDKAYLVGFDRSTPFTIIDIKDPRNPKPLGELSIPGYATYLHPVGEKHFFSFGYNLNNHPRINGLKAELIKVKGSTGEIVSTFIIPGGSQASKSHKEISVQKNSDDEIQIAIPVSRHRDEYSYGAQLFTLKNIREEPVLIKEEFITAHTGQLVTGDNRSKIQFNEDAIFINFNEYVWAASKTTPGNVQRAGPPGE